MHRLAGIEIISHVDFAQQSPSLGGFESNTILLHAAAVGSLLRHLCDSDFLFISRHF